MYRCCKWCYQKEFSYYSWKIYAKKLQWKDYQLYTLDSAGVYLPLQDEIFPDKEHLDAF
jgi:hypothetical protein